jgi:hypothetical protein
MPTTEGGPPGIVATVSAAPTVPPKAKKRKHRKKKPKKPAQLQEVRTAGLVRSAAHPAESRMQHAADAPATDTSSKPIALGASNMCCCCP